MTVSDRPCYLSGSFPPTCIWVLFSQSPTTPIIEMASENLDANSQGSNEFDRHTSSTFVQNETAEDVSAAVRRPGLPTFRMSLPENVRLLSFLLHTSSKRRAVKCEWHFSMKLQSLYLSMNYFIVTLKCPMPKTCTKLL